MCFIQISNQRQIISVCKITDIYNILFNVELRYDPSGSLYGWEILQYFKENRLLRILLHASTVILSMTRSQPFCVYPRSFLSSVSLPTRFQGLTAVNIINYGFFGMMMRVIWQIGTWVCKEPATSIFFYPEYDASSLKCRCLFAKVYSVISQKPVTLITRCITLEFASCIHLCAYGLYLRAFPVSISFKSDSDHLSLLLLLHLQFYSHWLSLSLYLALSLSPEQCVTVLFQPQPNSLQSLTSERRIARGSMTSLKGQQTF
jgi:hypothetical protein